MEDRTPRIERSNLHNINKALVDVNFSEIEEEKVSIVFYEVRPKSQS